MALKRTGVELVADNASTFLRTMESAEASVRDFGRQADGASKQVGAFEQMAIGGFRRIGAAAVDLSIQGGKALVGLIGDTLTAAGDFEATLNNFASKTGGAMEDAGLSIQDFSAEFLRLGAETKFSAAEAGDAAVELAKGGVSVTQIMGEATEATLSLAAAADLELAPAATIVAKQLGVWGDQGVSATNVVDLLAQAANASTVDVDELALGLANAGGTAKVAGLSFEETVQAMALLAPGFSSAADAGTSFKTFLSRLIPTTKTATGWMIDLGLYSEETGSKFYDSTGSFIGMEQATKLLNTATKDLNQELKIQALQAIFGQDAIRVAAILSEQGAVGFNNMGAAMANAGSAAEQATKMNQGYNFAMESLKGSIETVQIILGTMLLPTFTALAGVLADGTNVLAAFAKGGDDVDAAIATFQASLTEISPTLGKYFGVLTDGRSVLDGLGFIVGDLVSRIGPLGTTIQGLINIFLRGQDSLAQWTFLGRSIDAIFGEQLGGTITGFLRIVNDAVTAISQFVTTVTTSSEPLHAFVTGLGGLGTSLVSWIIDSIPAIIGGLIEIRTALFQWVIDSLPEWSAHLQALGERLVGWIIESIPGWQAAAVQFYNEMVAWIEASLPGWIESLKQFGNAIVQWVVDSYPGWQAAAVELFNAMVQWVIDSYPGWVAALQQFAGAVVQWIKDSLPGWQAAAVEFFNSMVAWVEASLPGWMESLKQFGRAAIQWIKDTLPGLGENLGEYAGALIVWVAETTITLTGELLKLAAVFLEWVATSVLPKLPGVLWEIAKAIGNFLIEMASELGPALLEFGGNIIAGITDGVIAAAGGLLDATVGAIEDTFTAVTDFLLMRSPSKLFRDEVGTNIMLGIAEGVTATQDDLDSSLIDAMGTALDTSISSVNAGKVADTIRKVADAVGAAVESLGKLKDFEAPAREALTSFSYTVRDVVADFWHRAQEISYALDESGDVFAGSVGKVVGVIGAAVDGFAKLADYTSPARSDLERFSYDLRDAVADFWHRAQEVGYALADDIAPQFADLVGKAVAAIGQGVTAFTQLASYRGVAPAQMDMIFRDIQSAVMKMVTIAEMANTEGVEKANAFSQSILAIFGALKAGIDALNAMREFETVAGDRMETIFADIRRAVDAMVAIAAMADIDGVTAASEFSAKVITIFSALKTGIDALDALRDYESIPSERMAALETDFNLAVGMISRLAGQATAIEAEGSRWQQGLEQFAASIRAGIDALASLDGMNVTIQASASVSSGDIAAYASGGMTQAGLATLGEMGLERVQGNGIDVLAGAGLYSLPAGLDVTPASETARILGGERRSHAPMSGQAVGQTITNSTTNSPSYSIVYNTTATPPPPSQSFAALAAWAG